MFSLLPAGQENAAAFPNGVINLKEAIERQNDALNRTRGHGGFRFGILGSVEMRSAGHRFQADWKDALARIESEKETYALCDGADAGCGENVRRWRETLAALRDKPVDEQLAGLNRFINHAASYADDLATFGRKDHWATPLEFFRGRADCEDYAAVKFWSLLELGFNSEQLRLAVVKDQRRQIMHAVVTVNTGDRTIVLDSLFDHPVEQRHVLKYAPIFSANLDSQWVHIVTRQIRVSYLDQVEKGAKAKVIRASAAARPLAEPAAAASEPHEATREFVDWT